MLDSVLSGGQHHPAFEQPGQEQIIDYKQFGNPF